MTDTDPLRRRLAVATVGDYEIIEELGRGGMATVLLARDLALDRLVAIKVMAPELVAVPGMAERFLQEARVAASLTHPHIVPIHAVRRSGDLLWFAMRFVAGRALDRIVAAHGPLSSLQVRAVLTQVGGALDAAHRRGVVHRDIKPANILIDEHGDALVADFGIARCGDRGGMTQAGQTVGTPEYMSPEQCAGGVVEGAADQYSLGVVAYELLTGAPPFRGENLMQVVWRMVHEPLVPLAERRSDVEPSLAAVVHRMLAKDPADRWPTVADAVAALPPLTLAAHEPSRRELAALARDRSAPRASVATVVAAGSAAPLDGTTPAGAAAEPVGGHAVSRAPVALLRLPLGAAVMTMDDAVPLSADAVGTDGAPVAGAPLQWATSDADVVRVTPDGVVSAVGVGRATVTVSCDDARAVLELLVTRAGLRAGSIAPRPPSVEVGDRVALQLAGADSVGLPHPRLAHWRTSVPAVATVDPLGVLTAHAEGAVEVQVSGGGVTAVHALRVTKAVVSAVSVRAPAQRVTVGERLRLGASPANTKGHPLPGLEVRWEVSDPAIAAIGPDGELVALRSGQVLVAARVGGRVGTTRVTVAAPALAG